MGPDCIWLHLTAVPLSAGRSAGCSLRCCSLSCTHCSFCSITRPGSVFSPRPVQGPTVPGRKISNFFAGFLDSSLQTKIYVAVLWVISAHRATCSGVSGETNLSFKDICKWKLRINVSKFQLYVLLSLWKWSLKSIFYLNYVNPALSTIHSGYQFPQPAASCFLSILC